MINLTPAFRQKLFNDERNYLEYADITLADTNHTVLHLTNADIWQNGFTIEDSVGEDNTFSALGSAIVNSFTLVINNIYETYSEYDFTNARVVVAVGMELPNPNDPTTTYIEKAWKGEFGVDEATYNGSIITLKCLDDMVQFDRPYSHSTLVYPATLGEIVRDACAVCLGSANDLGTQQFPHYTYSIPNRPDDEKLTFREVISWCAAIAGCFARMAFYPTANKSKLEIKWFNQSIFEQRKQGTDGGVFDTDSTSRYTTGDTLDGGTFNPWNTGDVADAGSFTDERPFHHITSLYQHNISVDDVVITGVRTTVKDDDTDSSRETITALTGTEGYVIDIANNDFITKTNATEIRTWLGQQLIGLTFRKATVTHPSDPSIEAGDIAFVYDRKGVEYPILVTRTVFQAFGMQTTTSGADTPNRNSATRYSQITKSYVENRKMIKHSQNPYAKALQDLANAVNSATGMYETDVTESGATIHYRHNKPNLEQSDIVIMESSVGITFTNNYQDNPPTWYGFTVDGNIVANLISALGINFEWAVGTTLTLGGANNGNGVLRVLDANGNQIGIWNNNGIEILKGIIRSLSSYDIYTHEYGQLDPTFVKSIPVSVEIDGSKILFSSDGKPQAVFAQVPVNMNSQTASFKRVLDLEPDETPLALTTVYGFEIYLITGDTRDKGLPWTTSSAYKVYLDGTNPVTDATHLFRGKVIGDSVTKWYLNDDTSGAYLQQSGGAIDVKDGIFRADTIYTSQIGNPNIAANDIHLYQHWHFHGASYFYADLNVYDITTQTYKPVRCSNIKCETGGIYAKTGASIGGALSLGGNVASSGIHEIYGSMIRFNNTPIHTSSDKRLKEDIKQVDNRLIEAIGEVDIVQFKWKNKDKKQNVGIIAQNLIEKCKEKSIDETTYMIVNDGNYKGGDGYYSVNYTEFLLARVAYDEKIIHEQQQKIESLEDRIEKLEKLVEKLL